MKKQVAYLQKLFYELWNDFGGVYLIVNHSDRTRIGRRGFTEEEKKNGLVLVFNDKTNTRLDWDDEGNLSCLLAFGTRKEDVYIHHDDLLGLFSPEAGVQFLRSDAHAPPSAPPGTDEGQGEDRQVVSLSTYRKKRTGGQA
jgi:hypothetical protein